MNNPRQRTAAIAVLALGGVVLLLAFAVASRRGMPETPVVGDDLAGRQSAELAVDPVYGDLSPVSLPSPPVPAPVSRSTLVEVDIPSQMAEALSLTAPVYRVASTPVITQAVGQSVADNLRMTGFPRKLTDGALSWVDNGYQVIVRTEEQRLTVFQIPPDYGTPAPSVPDALRVAERFLAEGNLLFADLQIDTAGAVPVAVGVHTLTSEPDHDHGDQLNAVYVPLVRATSLGTIAAAGDGVERAIVVDGGLRVQQVLLPYRPVGSHCGGDLCATFVRRSAGRDTGTTASRYSRDGNRYGGGGAELAGGRGNDFVV